MLLHTLSSAREWMDPCPIRGRRHEANDENYPTKANNYASIHGAVQSTECVVMLSRYADYWTWTAAP